MSLYEFFDVGISGVSFLCSIIAVIVSVYTLKCSGKANAIAEKNNETAERVLREAQKEYKPEIRFVGGLGIETNSKDFLKNKPTFDFNDIVLYSDFYYQDIECITFEIENYGKGTVEGLSIKKFIIAIGNKYDLEHSPDGVQVLYSGGSDQVEYFYLAQGEKVKLHFPIGDIIAESKDSENMQSVIEEIWDDDTNIVAIMNVKIYSSNNTSYEQGGIGGEYEKCELVSSFHI